MLSNTPGLAELLDRELILFLTAVNEANQAQTSPVWFQRDGEDIVVYNQPQAPRLVSIGSNPRVAFNLRADRLGRAGVSFEGTAAVEDALPPAQDFPGYTEKYGDEIANLGWTPASFSEDYSVGIRIRVLRVRTWGLSRLLGD